ncbi:uncharacterized protein STEHIDRAFT_171844 [Stereum hirsutum FP-91666 SS1]|uniref:uncharacterized protein n=1 Tax=Stereum hirsutum (strain FP-91666) TaxID=721885 RepID=UPI00044493EE|nr:uncharacterized protein STEHIDRAFT_171844 [Stereum hirsutum FP-91666 SS1]EIM81493.1 hypothetical protein STEHIDRAFT_171844 [Stereum hirsutum FP-91666 SS1]
MPFGIRRRDPGADAASRNSKLVSLLNAREFLERSTEAPKDLTEAALLLCSLSDEFGGERDRLLDLAQEAIQLCCTVIARWAGRWKYLSEEVGHWCDDLQRALRSIYEFLKKRNIIRKSIRRRSIQGYEAEINALKARERTIVSEGELSRPKHIPPAELPLSPPRFFGREAFMDQAIKDITSSHVKHPARLAIIGPNGIGKSSLALQLLHTPQIEKIFSISRVFIRCDAAPSAETLVATIAKDLTLQGSKGLKHICDYLSDIRTGFMLVLDNFETPWEADKHAAEDILRRLSSVQSVTLLITMRGKEVPLDTRWSSILHLPTLPKSAARETFLHICSWHPHFASDPNLDKLLECVDYVPLAVTLLATVSTNETSLANVLNRWDLESTSLLADGPRSLHASIEVSLHSTRFTREPGAQDLLSILALLPTGMSHESIRRNDLRLHPSSLAAANALRRTALAFDDPGGRLRLLHPIRIYIASHYPPSHEVLHALRTHLSELTERAKLLGTESGIAMLPELRDEVENLQAMMEHDLLILHKMPTMPLDTLSWVFKASLDLKDLLWYTGLGSTRVIETARKIASSRGQQEYEADCLSGIGFVDSGRTLYKSSMTAYSAALKLYDGLQNLAGKGECLRGMGYVARHMDDQNQALRFFSEGRDIFQNLGSEGYWGMAECLRGLALMEPDYTKARNLREEALALFRQVGNLTGEGDCMLGLATDAARFNEPDVLATALSMAEKARELYARVGKTKGVADCAFVIGNAKSTTDEWEGALSSLHDAFAAYKVIGNMKGMANSLRAQGELLVRWIPDSEEIEKHYRNAASLYESIEDVPNRDYCEDQIARLQQERL